MSRGGRRRPRISMTLVAWAAVLFCVFIAGGGVYDLIDNPGSMVVNPWTGRFSSIDWRSGEQTLNESLVSMALTMFMFAGLLVAYRSTQIVYDQKRANMMLVLGVTLILLGLAGSHYLFILRRTVGR